MNKLSLSIILGAFFLTTGWFVYSGDLEQDWNKAREIDTVQSYENLISQYSDDYYVVSLAKREILALETVEEKYNNEALNFEYRKGMLKGYKQGQVLKFRAGVYQVTIQENRNIMLVATDWWNEKDLVWLELNREPQALKGDYVKIYGRYLGTQSYKTIGDTIATVPKIQLEHIFILAERIE